jgi:glycosyltransferase involved in cell wall biosynthesis
MSCLDLYIHDYAGHIAQLEVARALAVRGHKVRFTYCDALPTPRGDLSNDGLPNFEIEAIGIGRPIIKRNYFKRQWQDVLYARALMRDLRRHKPDVVISANNPLIPQWPVMRYCRRHKIPLVHWWTDVYCRAVEDGVRRKFGKLGGAIAWVYEQLEIHLLKRSQAVLAITPQFRAIAESWGVKTPLTVIPVVAPTDQLTPEPKRNPWSERHGVADTTNVVYCGTMGNKHHPELIWELAQSVTARADCRMVIAAEGVGAEWLGRKQEEAQLPHLVLLPYQSIEDYPHVLAAGDVHVTTLSADASVYALPSRVMSQLCAGRAQLAIVPRENYVGQLVAEAEAGVVVPPAEFATAIGQLDELLDDSVLRERYAANGRRYAEQRLSIESVMPRYEQLLDHVTGREAGRRAASSAEPVAAHHS